MKTAPGLPDFFTNILPVYFTKKNPFPPKVQGSDYHSLTALPRLQLAIEYEWLEKVSVTEEVDGAVNFNWFSAHHAFKKRSPTFEVSIASLLPLLRDEAHSIVAIWHVMDKIKDTVALLNPGQVPVITADHPIYAVAKQMQWQWPECYSVQIQLCYVWRPSY